MATLALEAEEARAVPPLARVRRRHLALALSVTLAGLPVLALDNLPATAETNQEPVCCRHQRRAHHDALGDHRTEPPGSHHNGGPRRQRAPHHDRASHHGRTHPHRRAPGPAGRRARTPTRPPTTAPPRPAPPPPAPRHGDPSDPATWERLAQCESGGNWVMNAGNGYFGGLQFSLATWQNVGGAGYPHQASKAEQIKRGQILQARGGWGQWPGCARDLGYL